MKKLIMSLIFIVYGILITIGVMAQPSPPSNQGTAGNQTPPAGPSGAPIDPGTGILLILATGFGLKKIYDVTKMPEEKT